ncbi:FAD binding domain-containing protein [Aureimonas mangrovi]|uniref:FAD binding domain-containing protein n=1 Tax=Aureimonas mangrovi TaxID=2758041 RepID=UPI00163DDE17|nr:xanthine dehydrogenase family protein subunit M [Aureimonas mangrovi]
MRPFAYSRASSSEDAVRRLAMSDGAKLMAGGTTLYDLMKIGAEAPSSVIDINALHDLSFIEADRDKGLRLGALARMSDVAAEPAIVEGYPAISQSLWLAASQQLRNMASLGGNLLQRTRCAYFRTGAPYACNKREPGTGCSAVGGIDRGHALFGASQNCSAVYPGDFAIALVAFDAQLDVLGPNGNRTLPVEGLYRDPGGTPEQDTTIAADEIITAIRVPVTPFSRRSTYLKIRDRASYAFALVSAAVALDLEDGIVRQARIALGGVATRPWRARSAEAALVGRHLDRQTALDAGGIAFADARPGEHNGFKIELGRQTVADALMTAAERI